MSTLDRKQIGVSVFDIDTNIWKRQLTRSMDMKLLDLMYPFSAVQTTFRQRGVLAELINTFCYQGQLISRAPSCPYDTAVERFIKNLGLAPNSNVALIDVPGTRSLLVGTRESKVSPRENDEVLKFAHRTFDQINIPYGWWGWLTPYAMNRRGIKIRVRQAAKNPRYATMSDMRVMTVDASQGEDFDVACSA